VRQGGVLSPLLFACYVDCVLDKQESSNVGCFIGKHCFNSFMYADDLILLSISVTDLQKMINLCCEVFAQLNLTINAEKSHCLRIGPRFKMHCNNITVHNNCLSWEKKTKFLGITILSGSCFTCDWHDARSSFYRTTNTILGSLGSNPPIDVVLKLINSKSLPILMYGMSAVSVTSSEMNKISFAYNSVFCKLFHIKTVNDIKFCQYYSGHWEFYHLHNYYRFCFLNKLFLNDQLSSTSKVDEPDLMDLTLISKMYNLNHFDSKSAIRRKIWKVVEDSMLQLSA
jgi:hypothetical protein